MPELEGVSHVSLTVRDVEASTPWYERLFDAQKLMDDDEGGVHRSVVLLAPGGLLLGLHQHASTPANDRFSEFRVGLDHVSFACPDRAAVAEWQARLEELGIAHSGITDAPYGNVLVFRDPDNIQLEFFSLPS